MQIVKLRTQSFYPKYRFPFWQRWIIANAIVECLSCVFITVAQSTIYISSGINSNKSLLLLGLAKGIAVGIAQCYILRPYFRKSFWWVIATTVGTLCGWIVILAVNVVVAVLHAFNVYEFSTPIIFLGTLLLGGYMGTAIGFAQGVVLKAKLRSNIQDVTLWINTNAFAWSLAFAVGFIGTELDKSDGLSLNRILVYAITGSAMGLVTGGITSIAWVRHLA